MSRSRIAQGITATVLLVGVLIATFLMVLLGGATASATEPVLASWSVSGKTVTVKLKNNSGSTIKAVDLKLTPKALVTAPGLVTPVLATCPDSSINTTLKPNEIQCVFEWLTGEEIIVTVTENDPYDEFGATPPPELSDELSYDGKEFVGPYAIPSSSASPTPPTSPPPPPPTSQGTTPGCTMTTPSTCDCPPGAATCTCPPGQTLAAGRCDTSPAGTDCSEGGSICVCEKPGETLRGNQCVTTPKLAHKGRRVGKCKCNSLWVHAGPLSYGHQSPTATTVKLVFDLQWFMTCTSGEGKCRGSFTIVPPPGHGASVTIAKLTPGHVGKFEPNAPIKCQDPCGRLTSGKVRVRIDANATLDADHLAGQSLVFTIKRSCGGPQADEKITYVFDATGGLDLHNSDLGPVLK